MLLQGGSAEDSRQRSVTTIGALSRVYWHTSAQRCNRSRPYRRHMDQRRHRTAGASGQATVEHVAIVVVVALMLAAAGAWIASHVHPDRDPPHVVTRVWSGLDRITEPAPRVPDLGLTPRRRQPVIGRFVRRVGRVLATGNEIVAVGTGAFVSGFGHGLRGAVTDFVRDPVALLTGGGRLVTDVARDPSGLARAQLDAAIEYAKELKAMAPPDAYRTFMRDLGEATADALITQGKGLARNAMLRALKRRLDRRGSSTSSPPPGKRDGN